MARGEEKEEYRREDHEEKNRHDDGGLNVYGTGLTCASLSDNHNPLNAAKDLDVSIVLCGLKLKSKKKREALLGLCFKGVLCDGAGIVQCITEVVV